jgi:putative cell wall-binding protein
MRRKLRKPLAILLAFAMVFCVAPNIGFAADNDANSVERVSGHDRYETAANIAEYAFPNGADAVVIANGEPALGYADALAGSFLAGAAEAPILLTQANVLPDATAEAIETLNATRAYVLGGELAVSDAVYSELEALGLEVERVWGQNRYATAVKVYETGAELVGTVNTALIANATRPSDALAAGAYANEANVPVLLVDQDSIHPATEAALAGIENTFVIGGNLVVSDEVVSELDATRVSGRTRNATSVAVAETLWESPENFVLVNGADGIVDALAGSVLGMPILYVPSDDVDAYLDKVITANSRGLILGGVNRISDEFLNEIQQKIEGVEEELQVVSVSAINANQISVKFEGVEEAVTIDLEAALVDGENEVTFEYEGQTFTVTVSYEAPDTEAPVLVYDGETTINLENGAEFTIPEVTATDNKDEDVEVTHVITDAEGNVLEAIDTTVAGTYTITYSAVDAVGNAAESLVVTVNVAEEALKVESVSVIDANTISVTFDNGETVEVTLEEALVHGQTEVTFLHEEVEYTAELTEAYVDPEVVYEELKAAVEAKVVAFEELANGDLSTQELIDVAYTAKAEIDLEGLTEEDAADFQARIDAANEKVNAAQEALNEAKEYEEVLAGVEAKVAHFEELANEDLSTQELINEANVAKALINLEVGLTEEDAAAFQARIDAADALVVAAQGALDNLTAATKAVEAYEVAALTNADEVIAAEALAVTANEAVALVVDEVANAELLARIEVKDALVAEARTAEEAKAIALINNSTVFNIIQRLSAPILGLEDINPDFAAEYQQARLDNFTDTKEQIQKNVINFVNEAEQTAVNDLIEDLNQAINDYINAMNTTEQGQAVDDMETALTGLEAVIVPLTDYDALNNDEYMVAFAAMGTVNTFEEVQNVITQVNAEVQLEADVAAAQTLVEALFDDYDAKEALGADVDQEQIDAALTAVEALDDAAEEKAGLLADVQIAQDLLDAQNLAADVAAAQAAVEALFGTDAEGAVDKTALAETTDQEAIDEALVLINALDDAVTEKAGLLDDIQIAQVLLDIQDAQAAVEALFGTDAEGAVDKTALAETADQEAIDEALVLVNALDDAVTEKAGLLVDIQDAQDLLDAADLLAAQAAVEALFGTDAEGAVDKTALAETADQEAIDEALVLVNALDDAVTEKVGLLVDIQDAQDLLDAADLLAAQEAVKALFADYSTKAALAETADQEAIDEALVLINALDDAVTEKAGLLVDIQDAQDLLDEQTELALVTAVNDATLVAGMETALTNLNYAPYINLGSAKRAEVAELFLAVEGETEFETQAAIELAIDSVISQYNTLIANVNNAGTIVELRAALQAVVDAGFTLTNLTNNPVQLTETEIVFDAMQSDDFTAFRTIADIDGAAAGL